MGKNDMARLSWWAHWYLPQGEAEGVIAGYGDEAGAAPRAGGERPREAAKKFVRPQSYYVWLGVFAILAACAVIPVLSSKKFGLEALRVVWKSLFSTGFPLYRIFLAVGVALPLVWFRRHGQKNGTISKWLVLALVVVLVFGVGTMAWNWHVFDSSFLDGYAEVYPLVIPWQVILQRELIINGGVVCALIALAGLILAKCYDRRWLALYTLAVTDRKSVV